MPLAECTIRQKYPELLTRLSRYTLGLAVLALSSVAMSGGTITVSPTVTGSVGAYLYSFTITNTTLDDPFIIDIPVPKLSNAVSNLTAPAGFKVAFDSGFGLVSFIEDTALFNATPRSGFSFTSAFVSGATSFKATTLSATTGNVITVTGPTLAPSQVPEPTSGILLLLSGIAIGVANWSRPKKNSVR